MITIVRLPSRRRMTRIPVQRDEWDSIIEVKMDAAAAVPEP